jgi:hypothetical protein
MFLTAEKYVQRREDPTLWKLRDWLLHQRPEIPILLPRFIKEDTDVSFKTAWQSSELQAMQELDLSPNENKAVVKSREWSLFLAARTRRLSR